MRILGLDPGSVVTGFGLVERRDRRLAAIDHGCIRPRKGLELPARLAHLSAGLDEVIDRHRPEVAALESLYRGKNSRSAIVLAHARGALVSTLARADIEVVEYAPATVKAAVTGSGRADKLQVATMVRRILGLGTGRLPVDASDALAVAICCLERARMDRLEAATRPDGRSVTIRK